MNENKQEKKITLKDLTRVVQGDLLEIKTNLKEVQSSTARLETDMIEVKATLGNVEANLNKKVDKFTHNDLEYRVEKLEKNFV